MVKGTRSVTLRTGFLTLWNYSKLDEKYFSSCRIYKKMININKKSNKQLNKTDTFLKRKIPLQHCISIEA